MKETQARRQEREDRCCLVNAWRDGCRGAMPVAVLQEAGQTAPVVEPRPEVIADRPGVMLAQPIVESLVIGVIETLLLQGPFEIPVGLRHERELRNNLTNTLSRCRPEERRAIPPR